MNSWSTSPSSMMGIYHRVQERHVGVRLELQEAPRMAREVVAARIGKG